VLRPAGAAPACLVVPVRTKKRFSVPREDREVSPEEKEKRLRSLATAFPEERIERTFYLACTGGRKPALVSAQGQG